MRCRQNLVADSPESLIITTKSPTTYSHSLSYWEAMACRSEAVSEEIAINGKGRSKKEVGDGAGRKSKNGSFVLGACGLRDQGKQLGKGRRSTGNLLHLHYSGGSGEVAEWKNEDHRRLGQIGSQKGDLGTTNH
jgi:hypothetical protein